MRTWSFLPNILGEASERSIITKWALTIFLAAVFVMITSQRGWSALQTYRDYVTGSQKMIKQSLDYDEAHLYVLGESSDPSAYQLAMLISERANDEDLGVKNAVLFECGMHGREWYAAENCYWLIDYLLENRHSYLVRELLANVDVWVIPQSNPAGRLIDDTHNGDPKQFAYVCKEPSNKRGDPCTTDNDCRSFPTGDECYKNGWRSNANRTTCGLGVDPARNFSSGWYDAPQICDSADIMQFRGNQPFSERETLNLRRFVHNHMLSMVSLYHSNSHEISNNWYNSSLATQYMTDQLVNDNFNLGTSYTPNPAMVRTGVGTGHGQFSAWLTEPSNVINSPDQGTQRNISTFYFELPFDGPNGFYYGTSFEDTASDGSNSYHPSSDTVKTLWDDAIRPLLLYLIRQARSPQCPISTSGRRLNWLCEARDFGLVGAKIANDIGEPGLLSYDFNTRWELLSKGTHKIVFAVKNFSKDRLSKPPVSTNAMVRVYRDGVMAASEEVHISQLRPGQRRTLEVDHDFVMGDYEVKISLSGDGFAENNEKIFKFRVPKAPLLVDYQVSLGTPLSLTIDRVDRLAYTGRFFPSQLLDPQQTDIKLVLYGHHAHIPGSKTGTMSVEYLLPKGSPWWDKSVPAEGLWIYFDAKGVNSGVRKLTIKQPPNSDDGKFLTEISLIAKDRGLKALSDAQSYRLDLNFIADSLRLSSLAPGTMPKPLLDRPLPDDETEKEP